jgi:hypothetical protein
VKAKNKLILVILVLLIGCAQYPKTEECKIPQEKSYNSERLALCYKQKYG